jgi:hypothetical protein
VGVRDHKLQPDRAGIDKVIPTQPNPASPSATDLQGGLPPALPYANPNPTLLMDAGRNDQPYNQNMVPGYDQSSQYVGATTPLDTMNQQEENLLFSPNPMDDNWAGQEYTQSLVDAGYYKGNEVSIMT